MIALACVVAYLAASLYGARHLYAHLRARAIDKRDAENARAAVRARETAGDHAVRLRRARPVTLEELEARWRKEHGGRGTAARPHRVRLLNPPPWPLRLRRVPNRAATWIGCWLAHHVSGRAAEWWWRALRMWHH